MLTPRWTKLDYHSVQSALWRTKAQFSIVCAGRGSGKSELAKRRMIRYLPIQKPWQNPIYFYALPTWNQAKRVAWRDIKALTPPEWVIPNGISETDMSITTVFGSTLYVLGMDKPQRIEGVQWDGCTIDECSDQRPGAFDLSVLPALSHKRGWCWRIGVPKRFGIGAREFREAFETAQKGDDLNSAAYTWPSEDIVPPEAIEWAQANLDPVDYNEQYRARWETAGGMIFYGFHRVESVTASADYDPRYPIIVGQDFNVDPMAWTLSQRIGDRYNTFDEIWLRHTHTEAAMNVLWERWGSKHERGWLFIGDASARARKTSAARSDYIQIKSDERFKDKRVHYPKANPSHVDRFAQCNAVLQSANGVRRAYVHPRCVNLIRDFESRVYKEGTREPADASTTRKFGDAKSKDIGHITDAWGYGVVALFPLNPVNQGTGQIGVRTEA